MRPTRRGLLLGATLGTTLGAALTGCGTADPATVPRTDDAAPLPAPQRFRYAEEHPSQYADLRLPAGRPRGMVVLLHGGYWLQQFPAGLMEPLADRLTRLGLATWNVEYRRLGDDGGVPETLADVAAAIDYLALPDGPGIHAEQVVLLGHSAGGQLAVWAASRRDSTPGGASAVDLAGAISLSGVLDLTKAGLDPRSSSPVRAFVGGSPKQVPNAYAIADPSLLVPPTCPVWAIHAEDDEVVPFAQSAGYVARARAAGARATTVTVPGDHSAIIDPLAPAFAGVRRRISAALR